MPAYNFKAKFAEKVRTGKKRQTIRKPRKRPTVPGDRLTLYTGMRTKNCELLRATFCKAVTPVVIREDAIELDGACLSRVDTEAMAAADGFGGAGEFFEFFRQTYGLPVEMQIVRWY